MKWTVGIDLGALDRGAVAFAGWLRRQSEAEVIGGVHVAEIAGDSVLRSTVGLSYPNSFVAEARKALAPLHDDEVFAQVDIVEAISAAEGLADAAQDWGAGALVIGSTKYSPKSTTTHLGRVGRRLLRHLALPTVVVPADLQAMRDGPILLATDLKDASEGAVEFAKRLATDLGRPLSVAHVRAEESYFDTYLAPNDHKLVVERATERQRTEVDAWLKTHGLAQAKTMLMEGSATPVLVDVARDSDVSMIVVGSRGLSTLQRLFSSSTAAHLAAHAAVPVAVVPNRS